MGCSWLEPALSLRLQVLLLPLLLLLPVVLVLLDIFGVQCVSVHACYHGFVSRLFMLTFQTGASHGVAFLPQGGNPAPLPDGGTQLACLTAQQWAQRNTCKFKPMLLLPVLLLPDDRREFSNVRKLLWAGVALSGASVRAFRRCLWIHFLLLLHLLLYVLLQADCMGLGKTVQTVSFLAYLHEKKGVRNPHLILAPLSTLHGNWRFEFKKWWPSLRIVVYEGAKEVGSSSLFFFFLFRLF